MKQDTRLPVIASEWWFIKRWFRPSEWKYWSPLEYTSGRKNRAWKRLYLRLFVFPFQNKPDEELTLTLNKGLYKYPQAQSAPEFHAIHEDYMMGVNTLSESLRRKIDFIFTNYHNK
jgi:hypothetical protein